MQIWKKMTIFAIEKETKSITKTPTAGQSGQSNDKEKRNTGTRHPQSRGTHPRRNQRNVRTEREAHQQPQASHKEPLRTMERRHQDGYDMHRAIHTRLGNPMGTTGTDEAQERGHRPHPRNTDDGNTKGHQHRNPRVSPHLTAKPPAGTPAAKPRNARTGQRARGAQTRRRRQKKRPTAAPINTKKNTHRNPARQNYEKHRRGGAGGAAARPPHPPRFRFSAAEILGLCANLAAEIRKRGWPL